MAITTDDPHFREFASSLKKAIERYGQMEDKTFLERQKLQVDTLIALEREFKRALIAHQHGKATYKRFIEYICDERKNILDARPYFRERQSVFTEQISVALRQRSERRLFRFNFNYRFVSFVLNQRNWGKRSMLVKLGKRIAEVRDELVTMNMPLAISRARIFYSRTPKSHLSRMDLVQIACEGLMSGVDKFVPPFSKAFRSVAIGRMTGNFIEQYSETPIHFFPRYKRILYRINKLVGRGVTDPEKLAELVNEGLNPSQYTTAAEVSDLMAAASTVSADTPVGNNEEDGVGTVADRFAAPADHQPDVIVERQEALSMLSEAMGVLTPFENKLLRLKGVSL
jgi:RNA polymerase sigma factor (sigma-70 family)